MDLSQILERADLDAYEALTEVVELMDTFISGIKKGMVDAFTYKFERVIAQGLSEYVGQLLSTFYHVFSDDPLITEKVAAGDNPAFGLMMLEVERKAAVYLTLDIRDKEFVLDDIKKIARETVEEFRYSDISEIYEKYEEEYRRRGL